MDPAPFPDFAAPARLAAALAAGALLVVILMIAPGAHWSWEQGVGALFAALWTALSIAVALGVLRPWLSSLPSSIALMLACASAALVSAAALAALYLLDRYSQAGLIENGMEIGAFVGRGALVATVLTLALVRYLIVVDRWRAQVTAASQAQFEALQARIRPHFLFNSMNTIAALIAVRPSQAEEAVLDLSDLFRASLGSDQGPATLEQELELLRRYLAIEKLRLGEKLQVHYDLPPALPVLKLPRLLLQPLAENAVLHGIGLLNQGGELSISVMQSAGEVVITLKNPVPAISPSSSRHHAGHALESVRARLRHFFGPKAQLRAGPRGENIYEVVLTLPLTEQQKTIEKA